MKILYVIPAIAIWGGRERILVDKANGFAEMYDDDVCILTTDQGNHPIPYTLNTNVRHIDIGIRFHLQYQASGIHFLITKMRLWKLFRKRFADIVRQLSPDVILCLDNADYLGAIKRVCKDIPLVYESHSMFNPHYEDNGCIISKWMRRTVNNSQVNRAQYVVTLTDGDAAEWRSVHPRVVKIANIVHLNEGGALSSLQNSRVIFAGRFEEQKGVDDLIEIWKRVHERYPDWILDMYGEGGLKQRYIQQVQALGINIEIHDPAVNIFSKYRESSVLVLTSVYEPFGLVIPEAMSCGLPVVSFDCPYGPAEIITDGVDGFLIKNRDLQAFSDCLCRLLGDEELRMKMGKAAIQSSRRFSRKNIMPQWKQFLEQLVDKN